jgi:hypothetical protein
MGGNRSASLTYLTRQGWHAAGLIVIFLPLYYLALVLNTDPAWTLLAFLAAFIHQGFVALTWRAELLENHVTRIFGRAGFYIYVAIFFILFVGRLAVAVGASLDSPRSLPLPAAFWWAAAGIALFFFTWTIYSVIRYFGITRAAGGDHFFVKYRSMPFVHAGIHRYTPNAMYNFGTFGFLLPGLIFRSDIGLAVGLFNYLAVWLHYWATELPDMEHIYGKTP